MLYAAYLLLKYLPDLTSAGCSHSPAAGVLQSNPGEVGSVAVISPYKAQVMALRDEFRRAFGSEAAVAAAGIEFGTVDGFQVGGGGELCSQVCDSMLGAAVEVSRAESGGDM
jgi:hypothetical protein